MDVGATPSVDSVEKRYAELAKKTNAAINAEGPAPNVENKAAVKPSLPQLPRYEPPPPPPQERDYSRMVCRMFFPTSGHLGFDKVKVSDEFPSLEIVRQMILYETRLRLSDSIQALMDEHHHDEQAVTVVHDLVQQHVVEHFGFRDVNALRTALSRFPDDPIVQAAFYVKYNQITKGLVKQGECAKDVELYTPDGQRTNLFSQISAGQPLIVLAGSTS